VAAVVNTRGVPATLPAYGVTTYPRIGRPPLVGGACHCNTALALPGIACTDRGAPGTVASSSAMVPEPDPSLIVAPDGDDKVIVKNSLASMLVSPFRVTGTSSVSSPGGNVNVPEVAR